MTRKQKTAQNKREKELRACLPEAWGDAWVRIFRDQNEALLEADEDPLEASEFIRCRLEDLTTGDGVRFI